LNAIRTPLVRRYFARRYRGRAFDEYVALMAELKCLDRNMAPDEIARMQALAMRMRAPG
jgi:hypothetical protein